MDLIGTISTHALTEGDQPNADSRRVGTIISTHALTEGDFFVDHENFHWSISTHALTEGDSRRF